MTRIRRILVPLDFSHHSDHALDLAVDLARRFEAEVHVLHAVHLPAQLVAPDQVMIPRDLWSAVRDAAARRLEKTLQKLGDAGVEGTSHLLELPAPTAIVETASKVQADLIVMGTRGLTGLKHVILGSVAERVLRTAPCPVLTTRADDP